MAEKLSTFAQVRALTGTRAELFAAALVTRMLPNYHLFAQVSDFEGSEVMQKALDLVWQKLTDKQAKINFEVHLERVELATPDTADFDTFGVYPAIDAAIALATLLNLMLKQDLQGAVTISKLSQGSVEAYLLASEQADLESVKNHPLMQYEIETQQSLLSHLSSQSVNSSLVHELHNSIIDEGISNLGIEV